MSAKSISSTSMHVQVLNSSVRCSNMLMLTVSTAIVQVPKIVQEAVSVGPLLLPISWLSPRAASCCWSIQVQKLGVMGWRDVRRGRTSRHLKPDDLARKDAVEVAVLRPVKKVLQREVEVLRSCREIEKMQLWPFTGTKLRCLWWTGKIASPLSSALTL